MTATLDLAALRGSTTPRLWTPPLVPELNKDTTMGIRWTRWATEALKRPPDPWQRWLWMHAGELLPDGRPRFRRVLVIVSRQNGKTETPVILSTYWQFVDKLPLILGTSSKLDYAKESWTKAVKLVENTRQLTRHRPARWTRDANGEQESWTLPNAKHGSRYKIAAANKDAGRSLTVNRLIMDELRQHEDYVAWDAADNTIAAVFDGQTWALSNAGTDKSIVLNDLRASALEFTTWVDEVGAEHVAEIIRAGECPHDWRLGIFEWSAPPGSDPEDIDALLQANPNVGYRVDLEDLVAKGRRAKRLGGKALAGFLTENMCITVPKASEEPGALADARWAALLDRASQSGTDVAFAVDIEPGRRHATIAAFSLRPDGRGHVEVVACRPGTAWLVPAIVLLDRLHEPVAWAIDAKSALEGPLKAMGITQSEDPAEPARGDLVVMGPSEVADAWGQFLDATDPGADALRHIGQIPLDAAVASAKTRPLGNGEALARRTSAGDITPLVAGAAARWVFHVRAGTLAPTEIEPGAWFL